MQGDEEVVRGGWTAATKHVDKNNEGHSYIIGLGNYTGVELVFNDKQSLYYGTHNIKNKLMAKVHMTARPAAGVALNK